MSPLESLSTLITARKRGVFVDAIVSPLGMGFEFRGNFLLAAAGADDDAVVLEPLLVVQKVADVNRVRTEEAVPASGGASGDTGDGEFQRFAVEHGNDPADGANEARTIEAGPSHRAGPGEIVNGAGENTYENLFRGPPELDLFGGKVFALGGLNQIEIVDVDVLLLGEALCRACRRADGIVGHRLGRTGDFDFDVRLLREQSADPGGQAAGRAEGLHRNPIKEILRGEKLLDVDAEFLFGLRKHPCGYLLTANFEEELEAFFFCGVLHDRTSCCGGAPPICDR